MKPTVKEVERQQKRVQVLRDEVARLQGTLDHACNQERNGKDLSRRIDHLKVVLSKIQEKYERAHEEWERLYSAHLEGQP